MDSDNILSILASLGAGQAQPAAPTNVLQQMAPQAPADPAPVAPPANVLQQAAPQTPPPVAPAQIAQAAVAASPQTPKPRRSLLDTIGRISDVFATVGGAHPLYQSTLDARADRATEAGDHALKVDAATISNATDKFKLGALENARLSQFARGLKAIGAAGGDVNQALPILGQRMGFDAQQLQDMQQQIAANPHAIDGWVAAGLDPTKEQSDKYLGITQVIRNKNTGEIQVLQPSADGSPARNLIPQGWEYVDTYKPVDLGGQTGMTGAHSPNPSIILPHTVKPDTVANNAQSNTNNIRTTGAQVEIAGMPARAKATDGGKASDPQAGLKIISDIQQSFDNLHRLQALPGEGGAVGNLVGAVGRTAFGQSVEAKMGYSPAAQEREVLAKNLANLQSDLIKSLPGNATRTRFEQEIQKKRLPDPNSMTYAIANRAIGQIREAYMTALQSQQTPQKTIPANNGWSVVGVK